MSWHYVVIGIIGFLAVITLEDKAREFLLSKGNKIPKVIQFLLALVGAGAISLVIFYIRHMSN
ncbi:hypothetical protein AA0X95_27030 [Bacillus sp. 1P10SD]|uniref:hypothetical protein n=1 Tax=Bacillus sp. 1P10SD TaxID=3132265 RepID=UPI0039A4A7D7